VCYNIYVMDINNEKKVIFEEDQLVIRSNYTVQPKSKMIEFVLRNFSFFVKDEKQANNFILFFIVFMLILSIFILSLRGEGGSTVSHDPNMVYVKN
jgi:hypothetical protein